jgi:uncharacterized protein YjdB
MFSMIFGFGSFGIVNAEPITAESIYEVSMNDAVAAVGTMVTMDVSIEAGTGFSATQLVFNFDPAKLRYVAPAKVSDTKGLDLKAFELDNGAGSLVTNTNDALAGQITIGYINMEPFTTGGNIFKLSFEVLPGAVGTVPNDIGMVVKEMVNDVGVPIQTTVKSGTVSIEVPLTGIALNKTAGTIVKGGTEQLTVSYDPDNTTDDKTVSWSSANTQVATVSDTGLVTAVGGGACDITATVGSFTATYSATVTVPLTNIALNKMSASMVKGASDQLSVTYNPVDTTDDKTVTWTSSNTNVATVDASGLIKAIGGGTATIRATVGSKITECAVTVKIPLTQISLNKTASVLKINGTDNLAVTYNPIDTTDDKTVTWTTSDSSVATVNNNGVVTAVKAGTATITAKVGSLTSTCSIKIGPLAPANFRNTERTNNSATLAWDVAQGAESYNVYKDGMIVNTAPITELQYKVEGLTPKTQYAFTVRSVGNGQESESSSTVSVKTMGNPVNLSVGTATGAAGKNVILKVDISGNSTISASQLIAGFDSQKLEYVTASAGSIAEGGTIVSNLVGNEVTIGYMNLTPLVEQGTFIELEFKIKEGVEDQNLPITLSSKELVDENGFDLIPVITNGEIQVKNIKLGDVNGDGEIRAFDALTALQIATQKIIPTANQKYAADIDGNGSVTAFEALRILQVATGKIVGF